VPLGCQKQAAAEEAEEEGIKPAKPRKDTAAGNAEKKSAKEKAATKVKVEDVKVKRERKVFDMPGQTRETPPEVCVRAL
jgi:hypothetical protein